MSRVRLQFHLVPKIPTTEIARNWIYQNPMSTQLTSCNVVNPKWRNGTMWFSTKLDPPGACTMKAIQFGWFDHVLCWIGLISSQTKSNFYSRTIQTRKGAWLLVYTVLGLCLENDLISWYHKAYLCKGIVLSNHHCTCVWMAECDLTSRSIRNQRKPIR